MSRGGSPPASRWWVRPKSNHPAPFSVLVVLVQSARSFRDRCLPRDGCVCCRRCYAVADQGLRLTPRRRQSGVSLPHIGSAITGLVQKRTRSLRTSYPKKPIRCHRQPSSLVGSRWLVIARQRSVQVRTHRGAPVKWTPSVGPLEPAKPPSSARLTCSNSTARKKPCRVRGGPKTRDRRTDGDAAILGPLSISLLEPLRRQSCQMRRAAPGK